MFSSSSYTRRTTASDPSPGSFVHDFSQLNFTSPSCSCASCSPVIAPAAPTAASSWGSSSFFRPWEAASSFWEAPNTSSLAQPPQRPALNAVGWPIVYGAAGASTAPGAPGAPLPPVKMRPSQGEPQQQLLAAALTTNQLAAFSAIVEHADKLADIVEAPVEDEEEEEESEDMSHFIVPFAPSLTTILPTLRHFPTQLKMLPQLDALQAALELQHEAAAAAAAPPSWVHQLVDPFEEGESDEEKRPLSRWQVECIQSDAYLERPIDSDEESELADIREDSDDDTELPTDESAAWQAGAEYARSCYAAGWSRMASVTQPQSQHAMGRSRDQLTMNNGYGKRSIMPDFVLRRTAGQHEAFRRFQERSRPRMNAQAIDDYLSTTMMRGPKPGGGRRE